MILQCSDVAKNTVKWSNYKPDWVYARHHYKNLSLLLKWRYSWFDEFYCGNLIWRLGTNKTAADRALVAELTYFSDNNQPSWSSSCSIRFIAVAIDSSKLIYLIKQMHEKVSAKIVRTKNMYNCEVIICVDIHESDAFSGLFVSVKLC